MDVIKTQTPVICKQCRKEVKTEALKCIPCEKIFHPGCIKLHKVYNSSNELIPCKGKIEDIKGISSMDRNSVQKSNLKERKMSSDSSGGVQEGPLDSKIELIYKLVKELNDNILGKNLIKEIIREVIKDELDIMKQEMLSWKKKELDSLK